MNEEKLDIIEENVPTSEVVDDNVSIENEEISVETEVEVETEAEAEVEAEADEQDGRDLNSRQNTYKAKGICMHREPE